MSFALIRRGGLIWDLTGQKPMLDSLALHALAADLANRVLWENFQAGEDDDYWNLAAILEYLGYLDNDGVSSWLEVDDGKGEGDPVRELHAVQGNCAVADIGDLDEFKISTTVKARN